MTKIAERISSTPESDDFSVSVFEGLSRPSKSLPCRFFYDATGNALFEEITRQPEYYLTRAEVTILAANVGQILEEALDDMVLIEFGSGSSIKTEILIEQMRRLRAYLPIDVSESALTDAASRLTSRFSGLDVRPLVADFSKSVKLVPDLEANPKLGFFPGSTIGNFGPTEAIRLLRAMRGTLSPSGRLIVGVDLKKDVRRLLAAYNDAKGVTAAFNLNLLARINRELGGDFNLLAFRHEAIYEPIEGRVVMRLVSLKDQSVRVAESRFHFRAGEMIHTEDAYKYTIEQFLEIARLAGWTPKRVWRDDQGLFSVQELIIP